MLNALLLAMAAAMPAPATVPAQADVQAEAAAANDPVVRRLSADSTVAELLASPAAKAVLEKHIPMQLARPELELAKPMKLRTVASIRQAKISPETLHAIEEDLSKL